MIGSCWNLRRFYEDKEPCKLIVCDDLHDRGIDAKELQKFILDLLEKD